ncbi:MAG: hypothetical protein M3Z41_02070 [Candidatus Eremiobacteraeota bacterium]|nr:hypothetical protein [Candidatus Eremiobacteraeota bacterium]
MIGSGRACRPASLYGLAISLGLTLGAVVASASTFSQLHWRSIGPAVPGGRIAAVAGSDKDPFLYYVGGAGGVFKSTNGGASWDAVFADKPVASIGAIAVSASNSNDVWVGTGEGNPRADISYGRGVWRSQNGAKTWKHLGLDGTSAVTKILLDPGHPETALVAALGDPFADNPQRGVYRTTDGGKTWTKTLYVGPSTGASDLAWDPAHPSVIFAGMWQFRRMPWTIISGGPQSALYRSRDGGVHWEKLLGHGLPTGLMGRIGVAVAPNHPKRVYAIIQSKQGYVWRSDDGGSTWRRTRAGSVVVERPFYFSHLFVDPVNPDHVYAAAVDLSQSRDGGQTFKPLDNEQNVDYHSMWFSKDGTRIMAGHDAGWVLSVDRGKTWDWRLNMAVSQTYHIGYDLQNPYRICGGFQDAESFCGPSNSLNPVGILNRDWISLNASDGTWVWPDPLDPRIIWSDTYWGDLGLVDFVTMEEADVSPFQHDYSVLGTASSRYRFGWEAPIAFSPQDGHVMYFGGNVLWSTSDRGQHWKVISPDLTLNDKAHQQVSGGPITIEGAGAEFYDLIFDIGPSPLQAGLIWVGTDDGLIQLTRDGGATWNNVSVKGISPYGRVSTIEPSRASAATAYAVIDRHLLGDRTPYIFRTDDDGATWRRITKGLPQADYAHVVREDPKNPQLLYAGLEQGVWISFNGGAEWQSLQTDLPTSSVRDMRVHPLANDLIVGTHGNSLFILDDLTPLQEYEKSKTASVYLYPPRTAYEFALWVPEQPGSGTQPQLSAFAGENPKYGAIISYYLQSKSKTPPSLEIVDAAGRVVRHLGDSDGVSHASGINRAAWNLTEDPPVAWKGAPKWNRGPEDGADAIPGRYTARFKAGRTMLTQDFDMMPDPRAPWTHDQYVERHTFLSGLFQELSDVDVALNELDSLRKQLKLRRAQVEGIVTRHPAVDLPAQLDAAQRQADRILALLTSNPQAGQDGDFLPDQLRERIEYVISSVTYPLGMGTGSYGASYLGPPQAAHYAEAAEVRRLYDARMSTFEIFVKNDIAALNAALQKAGYQPIT